MNVKIKPLLRGHFHQAAFFTFLGACLFLIIKAQGGESLLSSVIYSLGLLTLFGVSALYHRLNWQPQARAILKRLDHSAIYLMIASSFTPICLLALPETSGHKMLAIIWSVAAFGVLQSLFWLKAPKWINAILYVITGWLIMPYFSELKVAMGTREIILLVSGGVTYTIGAICYGTQRPNLWPRVFGYHELFHVLVVIAAALHFMVIYPLV